VASVNVRLNATGVGKALTCGAPGGHGRRTRPSAAEDLSPCELTTFVHTDTPPDPHIPNPMIGWYPGGAGGIFGYGFCDGVPYPDGSYWHIIRGNVPFAGPRCVWTA
jgi:hypothetical protein